MTHRFARCPFRAPLLAAIVATGAALPIAHAADGPLFRFEGFDYYSDDLTSALRQQLYDAELQYHQAIESISNEALFDLHVRQEADRSGEDPKQLRVQMLAVDPPSQGDVEAFYEANKARIPAPLNQVRDRIVAFLSEQAMEARKQSLVEEIKERQSFELLVRAPSPPTVQIDTQGYPSKGASDAKVTVVEYADFQCPHCKQASSVLDGVVQRFGETVRLVYKDFPVNRSGISRLVAHGGVCALEQGRFWEYHDLAFDRQGELTGDSPNELAADLDLDMAAFERCYRDPATAETIARSAAEAQRLGVTGTPTLYVNGKRLVIEDLERDVPRAIERAIEEQG